MYVRGPEILRCARRNVRRVSARNRRWRRQCPSLAIKRRAQTSRHLYRCADLQVRANDRGLCAISVDSSSCAARVSATSESISTSGSSPPCACSTASSMQASGRIACTTRVHRRDLSGTHRAHRDTTASACVARCRRTQRQSERRCRGVWPMRSRRPMRCSSKSGSSGKSHKMTLCANWKLRPSDPISAHNRQTRAVLVRQKKQRCGRVARASLLRGNARS